MPHTPASPALSDLVVLDLTRARAGPTAVRQFADWGADVIKVEIPAAIEGGDVMGSARHGSDFQNLQRNKRSISINLKDPDGVEVLKRLVAKADIVIENYRPGVKHRLGIDYDTFKAINPRLIYGSISGFGQHGPYRDRPGFDQIAQGMGGLMSITGMPGQGPVRVGIPIDDLCAGIFLASGILVALHEREKSGEGQWVHTSLLQAQMFMLDFQAARWLIDKDVPPQAGNNHPMIIPQGVFETSDGHINIAAAGQVIWKRFCIAVDAEHLLEHPDYKLPESRSANRDALGEEIAKITRTKSSQHWIELLAEASVPCGPIYSIDQVFTDDHVQQLGATQKINSHAGEIEVLTQPVALDRTPGTISAPAPENGEHTDEVLASFGFSPDDIASLRDRNVI
ncbi:MAG: CoA transferase [Rhodospirillaceae bacterium]|jgi:crotonobetainyl-CoA:carnitine CoA-transferase CaiB-like acyl-CoA transferase|nr:CoA transferase [Rhodospirillaceae bacterium]MBT5107583.1 CoA transferase [Rhodospirillaceae bacterium]MBT5666632.1 CoA transferase [Rhodospirillaceae bacterium]MBT5811498.1 CoA transferase [Rhodospirillaceae bacterium]